MPELPPTSSSSTTTRRRRSTRESVAGHWIFGLGSRFVRDVMVAGEWVVLDRKLVRGDVPQIAARRPPRGERGSGIASTSLAPHTFEPKGGPRWQTTAA